MSLSTLWLNDMSVLILYLFSGFIQSLIVARFIYANERKYSLPVNPTLLMMALFVIYPIVSIIIVVIGINMLIKFLVTYNNEIDIK